MFLALLKKWISQYQQKSTSICLLQKDVGLLFY